MRALLLLLALPGMVSGAPHRAVRHRAQARAVRRRAPRRVGGPARARRQHQQRDHEHRPACARWATSSRAELDGLGFRTRWVDGAGFGRAGHLVAERPAAGARAARPAHRPPRHRVREGQPVPALRAPRRRPRPRARHHGHEGRQRRDAARAARAARRGRARPHGRAGLPRRRRGGLGRAARGVARGAHGRRRRAPRSPSASRTATAPSTTR